MEPQNKTVEEFFKDLPTEDKKPADIFSPEIKEEEKKAEEKKVEQAPEEGEVRKNRRHRRLEQQLEEARLELEKERAYNQGRSEAQKFSQETNKDDTDPRFLRIYGDKPETREAWQIQKELFSEYAEKIKQQTLQEIEEEQRKSQSEQREYESFIDSELESIEDEYNIDVTSDSPQARKVRREFLELVQTVSPKDEDGMVESYADFGEVFKLYQTKSATKEDNSRRNEIASNSMKQGGAPNVDKATEDATLAYLRQNGIRI